ncbi:MAG: helix-turn-helix domain-containing protein [Pseudomonadota bacterium]
MSKRTSKSESSLVTAAREMLAHARGEIELESYEYTPPPKMDVAGIRKKLGLSQKQFADHYGFAVSALREWEQGRRNPERSTRILLALIAENPKMVEKTLAKLSV